MIKHKYRLYSPTSLHNAYKFVKEQNVSVCKAAKIYGVPEQTLRDRVKGKIHPDCVTTGRDPIFSMFEEAKIVEHLKIMASYGYGYTKQETVDLASDYAVQLGKRSKDQPLTFAWFEGLRNRWPELKVQKPRGLEHVRAKMASEATVNEYFENLEKTLVKYDLTDKPHLIFNVDEKGISMDHKPPHIVHASSSVPAVTTGKSKTTTILGCGSASGVAIPPYYVFSGKRMLPELLSGSTPGADGTVSETGWSNREIFRDWMNHHFIKYIPGRSSEPVLLLVDGHKSHVSVGLAQWALERNIVLFVLPAHCSHILQPLDVGCYGPFQKIYNNQCHKFIKQTSATISRYNVCELSCKAYSKALSAENLQSAFKRCGIYPLAREAISPEKLIPAQVFESVDSDDSDATVEGGITCDDPSEFMKQKEINLQKTKHKSNDKKSRKTLSKIVSGKELSPSVILKMKKHEEDQSHVKKLKVTSPKELKKTKQKKHTQPVSLDLLASPQPGPSAFYCPDNRSVNDIHNSDEESVVDDEPCCVCGLHQPLEMSKNRGISFAQWAQCDGIIGGRPCLHWVHLKFCTPTTDVGKNEKFYCPHCVDFEE